MYGDFGKVSEQFVILYDFFCFYVLWKYGLCECCEFVVCDVGYCVLVFGCCMVVCCDVCFVGYVVFVKIGYYCDECDVCVGCDDDYWVCGIV